MILLAEIIHRIVQILIFFVIVQVVLSYFMDPYHPVRQTLDRFINPFLNPIRRILPPMGGLDFSPLVLIIGLQIIDMVLRNFLYSLAF
ncbi:MAG TPA: YggT family protein [Anaerolineales bacterium]|nr:YggT family protein [Anaerolineales bacterium]